MNVKNYAEIAANPEYIRKVSNIRSRLNVDDMTKPKKQGQSPSRRPSRNGIRL